METDSDYSLMDIRYAFLAGLVEGDGSIYLRAHKDPRQPQGVTFGMFMSVSNTKKVLLDFLKQSFKGNITSWQSKKEGRKVLYKWEIGGDRAEFILKQMYPYLISKKPQAVLAIKMQGMVRVARGGGGTTRKEYEEKMQMVKEMHALNAKGKDTQWILDKVEDIKERKVKEE